MTDGDAGVEQPLLRGPGVQWNTTGAERAALYPCDTYLDGPWRGVVRAVDVDASASWVYRWLCQLKVAPYSYDLLDNAGRRSPSRLTPGVDDLAIGQPFLVFTIRDFERDRHISGTVRPPYDRLFGSLAVTYQVASQGSHACRLVAKLDIGTASRWQRWRAQVLAVGDVVMLRKQLLTLRRLAESTVPAASVAAPDDLHVVGRLTLDARARRVR